MSRHVRLHGARPRPPTRRRPSRRLAELTPEDSSGRVALDGLAAATRGEIAGTLDAIARLSEEEEAVASVKHRLQQLEGARNPVDDARGRK